MNTSIAVSVVSGAAQARQMMMAPVFGEDTGALQVG